MYTARKINTCKTFKVPFRELFIVFGGVSWTAISNNILSDKQ